MQVLRAIDEVVRHQQHLGGHERMRGELGVVDLHQSALSGRGQSLESAHIGWTLAKTERGHPRRDRARRDQHDVVAIGAKAGDLTTDVGDDGAIDHTEIVGEGRTSDLGDDSHDEDGTG